MKAGWICLEKKDMIRCEKAMGFHWYIVRNFAGNDKVGIRRVNLLPSCFYSAFLATVSQNTEKNERGEQKITPFNLW